MMLGIVGSALGQRGDGTPESSILSRGIIKSALDFGKADTMPAIIKNRPDGAPWRPGADAGTEGTACPPPPCSTA
ncbi:hypothetical protein FHT39_001696 [Mitsuaria sp. BK045]|uniref:hypothetical protein n=1 Tax=unclassified Roseateles TaxID=2626991 RepID=UPI00161134FD|nr:MULTISPECIES: hypothetical protein [unclassified Roseateles]MBB3293057.1 hypothetical protein [Mitsuaria sp. BK041]MBB3362274.1 hypothetical protein [Mitsuaria sp. BK045]